MISPLASSFRGGFRNLTPMRGRGRGGANPWTPAMLPPYAWYDAELGQPKNVGYVQLAGTAGDNVSTPDSAALSFSGDIEVVMRVRVTDWAAASNQSLCGKYVTTSNQRSWRFYANTSGDVGLTASHNGTAVTSVIVTPTVALTDDAWIWLRLRLDLSNGANSVGTVETAADTGDNVEPSSWTANGTNTGVIIAGVFDSSAPLEIGSFANGASERLSGRVGRCIVRSGFAGTVVADFNADDCYGDGYTHTDGYRWTLGLPKIYDRSGNNHPPAVFGAGSNQPKWLPWLGVSCVHLEAATAGTNSISCTAPVGAASYVARSRDYPNVVDATGAAAAGAFTFTTAGQWQYVSILNGSAVEVARFDASLCTQTGMTDSYLVAWTINRGTAGRKTVVQSPVAGSARSLILHGTDDLATILAAAMPPMLASSNFEVVVVARQWPTSVTNGRWFDCRAASPFPGAVMSVNSGTLFGATLADGTNSVAPPAVTLTYGQRAVAAMFASDAGQTFGVALNAETPSTASAAAVGARTGSDGTIARTAPTASGYQDLEFEALVTRSNAGTVADRAQLVAYYRGGI